MKNIDNIIQESIRKAINEERANNIITEGVLDDIKNLLKSFKGKHNLSNSEKRKKQLQKKK